MQTLCALVYTGMDYSLDQVGTRIKSGEPLLSSSSKIIEPIANSTKKTLYFTLLYSNTFPYFAYFDKVSDDFHAMLKAFGGEKDFLLNPEIDL